MRYFLFISYILLGSCFNNGAHDRSQGKITLLSPAEFAKKINEFPDIPVVDVRTAQEFSKGHLPTAVNIDWNEETFNDKIEIFDKSKPILDYCLSGGRSAEASARLISLGFKEVYELKGGILKWRSVNLPEIADSTTLSTGFTRQQFDELLQPDKLILIDFYADWCQPCKKMKPFLDEISTEMAQNVQVIRINTEDNQALCKDLGIDALPTLQLYHHQELKWANTGYLTKNEVMSHLQ